MKQFFLALMVGSLAAVWSADSADARGLRGLFGGRGGSSCCEPVCCEAQPVCCEPAPVCCEPEPCCDSGRKHGRKGGRLFGKHRSSSCCDPCGAVSDCGCNGTVHHGHVKDHGHHGSPTEASPSDQQAAPEPPVNDGGQGPQGDVPPPPATEGQGGQDRGPEGGQAVEPDGAVDAAAANQDA